MSFAAEGDTDPKRLKAKALAALPYVLAGTHLPTTFSGKGSSGRLRGYTMVRTMKRAAG